MWSYCNHEWKIKFRLNRDFLFLTSNL
jgi:hypothetical protein